MSRLVTLLLLGVMLLVAACGGGANAGEKFSTVSFDKGSVLVDYPADWRNTCPDEDWHVCLVPPDVTDGSTLAVELGPAGGGCDSFSIVEFTNCYASNYLSPNWSSSIKGDDSIYAFVDYTLDNGHKGSAAILPPNVDPLDGYKRIQIEGPAELVDKYEKEFMRIVESWRYA